MQPLILYLVFKTSARKSILLKATNNCIRTKTPTYFSQAPKYSSVPSYDILAPLHMESKAPFSSRYLLQRNYSQFE